MGKDKVDRQFARQAYEMFSASMEWTRPDGSKIPRWNELSLNAQWMCCSFINVVLHYSKK